MGFFEIVARRPALGAIGQPSPRVRPRVCGSAGPATDPALRSPVAANLPRHYVRCVGHGAAAGWRSVALGAIVGAACSAGDLAPPPHATGPRDESGSSSADTGAVDPTLPDHCQAVAEPPEGEDTVAGIRFDVGSPDEALSFPFDCAEASTRSTNLGCEFWAVDLPNDGRGTEISPPAADQQFAVVVANPSALEEAVVEVFEGDAAFAVVGTRVPPQEARTLELPPLSIDPTTSTTDGVAYRVASSVPITAYQFNPLDNTVEVYSNDASLLFPTSGLGTRYTAVTGDAILLGAGPTDPMPINAGAFVSIVATVEGTQVTAEPTAALVGGPTWPQRLSRGQVLTLLSSAETGSGNLSGTEVFSDHPVAVFSGNVATAVPTTGFFCCADHLEHQMAPQTTWGNAYAVAPPPQPGLPGDDPAEYRIVGGFDGTELLYCPAVPDGAPTHIGAGEVATFSSDQPFTVRTVDPNHTFSLAQFLLSFQAIDPEQIGDPALLILPASAQFQRRYVFVIPDGYAENHITIVRVRNATVRLDGTVIEGAWNPLGFLGDRNFDYAQLAATEGSHLVESDDVVGLSVFGYDEAVSYAFPGGAGVRVISVPPPAG